ncbi:ABC transporter ATP-binding protein [Propionibacteriaceae bacterium Y1685]|uniref:ABC transporter ATP-binding protein n=1 Tax=Microlunatus sp. Y1700 TaxID=3418487 RepID=UPI003B827890
MSAAVNADVEAPDTAGALELSGITKRFGSLVANDAIDLTVRPGEIHCLLGENGAGKSTLMNILYGLLQPDEGSIQIDGQALRITNPKEAMAAGIGMVHQHFMLVDVFTVAENLTLGREGGGPFLSMGKARRAVRELSDRHGMPVDPNAIVEDLPVGVQQRVEILKALANDAQYLIFDEPTAVLTPQEIDDLMKVMRSLRDEGRAIVFITHKLREVRAIADRITVIRRGAVVGEAQPTATESELAEMMVGRSVSLTVQKDPTAAEAEARLELSDLTIANAAGQLVVDGVDLTVAGGEIVGLAGVQGNGQTELAEALLGLIKPTSGRIQLDGRDLTRLTTKQTIDSGIGFVPEDRKHDGFVGTFSVAENLVLNQTDKRQFASGPVLKQSAIEQNAHDRVAEFDIRTQSIDTPVGSLSGGNQQKVVLARELSRPLSLLVASQPTRGVDVGAIEFLHKRIVDERNRGTAVLIVSTELDEVLALSDRIAVMYRGKIVGIVDSSTSREVLGLMMAGIGAEEAMQMASTTTQDEEDAVLEETIAEHAATGQEDLR